MTTTENPQPDARAEARSAQADAPTAQADARDNSLAGARAWFAEKGLSRPREGRILAGVFAAFTRRYDLNRLVGRMLGITTIIVLSPLAYIAAWIVMPSDPEVAPAAAATA